jgi:hypothetical protein
MAKRVAIIQSSYIPWKGYFNIIKDVDEFVLLDDVQYTRRDWRNRNLIKTPYGPRWISIPVNVKGRFNLKINEVETAGNKWRMQHWNRISNAYKQAPFFKIYSEAFESLYLKDSETKLSIINYKFIVKINELLGITTPIRWSTEFDAPGSKNSRLVSICKCLGAEEYVSGPSAKSYLDESEFLKNGLLVRWVNYDGYVEYYQPYPPFRHDLTILDLIFNQGESSKDFFKTMI